MKKIYITLTALLIGANLFAQDIHFSQFFNVPMVLNPALTGFYNGKVRAGINYRNQWFTAVNNGFLKPPYMTTAVNIDGGLKVKNDVLGVGFVFVNDQAGANTFNTNMVMASGSYIKTIGKGRDKNHRIAAGFQLGYTFQNIKTENFQYANQYRDNIFVPTLSSFEEYQRTQIGFLNLNAGLLWYGKFAEKVGVYLGGSFFNISMPNHTVLAGESKKMYWRWNAHGGVDIIIAKKYHILPSAMFMRQAVNDQFNTGLAFGMDFEKQNTAFTIGFYNRIHNITSGVTKDALISYTSIETSGFKVGISYDVTISDLKNAGNSVGALELAVVYTLKTKNLSRHRELSSPRF